LGVIYHAISYIIISSVLLYINQYTKFEVPSFTNYKDMIEAKFSVLLYINQYTKFEVPSFTNYKDMIKAKFEKKRAT